LILPGNASSDNSKKNLSKFYTKKYKIYKNLLIVNYKINVFIKIIPYIISYVDLVLIICTIKMIRFNHNFKIQNIINTKMKG